MITDYSKTSIATFEAVLLAKVCVRIEGEDQWKSSTREHACMYVCMTARLHVCMYDSKIAYMYV
jgi:hypothetical protein